MTERKTEFRVREGSDGAWYVDRHVEGGRCLPFAETVARHPDKAAAERDKEARNAR